MVVKPAPDWSGLTETTSNAGSLFVESSTCDWARVCVACNTPNATGAATASNPAAPSNSFLPKLIFSPTWRVIIRTMRAVLEVRKKVRGFPAALLGSDGLEGRVMTGAKVAAEKLWLLDRNGGM